jgi:protein-S-isoprenylcysteine O-methyltransferase Ste14
MVVAIYVKLLKDRKAHEAIHENTILNVTAVGLYNACCYGAVILPESNFIPYGFSLLENSTLKFLFIIVGIIFIIIGMILMAMTVIMRRSVGTQDTAAGLIISGPYLLSRHPIYTGIILVSLGIALSLRNRDGFIVFPLIVAGNYILALAEERHDMVNRFRNEYINYQKRTGMFGPPAMRVFIALVYVVLILP